MQRSEVLDIVINNLKRNVDGLDDIDIDAEKSMAQYNASSLDIVEVVSASLRDRHRHSANPNGTLKTSTSWWTC
jgi:acyl carrier protein